MTLPRLFGQLDPLLRTVTAFAVYFSTKALEDKLGWPLHYLWEEAIAVGAGLLISALFSTRVWALPKLTIQWEKDGRILQGSSARLRIKDSGSRLLVVQHFCVERQSLLGLWLAGRIDGAGGLHIRLRTTDGAFRIVRDAGTVTQIERATDGFGHVLQLGALEGTVATLRLEWQPALPAVPMDCPVKYEKRLASNQGNWLASLVRMTSTVQTVELVD